MYAFHPFLFPSLFRWKKNHNLYTHLIILHNIWVQAGSLLHSFLGRGFVRYARGGTNYRKSWALLIIFSFCIYALIHELTQNLYPFLFQVERIIFCLFLPVDIAIYEDLMQYYFPGDSDTTSEEVKDASTEEDKNEEKDTKGEEELVDKETSMDMDKSRDEQSMDLDTTKEEIKAEEGELNVKEVKSEEEVKG